MVQQACYQLKLAAFTTSVNFNYFMLNGVAVTVFIQLNHHLLTVQRHTVGAGQDMQLAVFILRQALQLAQGNKAQAAKLLQLPYKTLLYRLEKYQLGN
ncbi:MAG: hypothetical protein KKE30_17030 [Gammaproteobacteria bacterium]|nr:hypothetical protein [Gammaproteobacteria bacterium]MBU1554207.1 hypothetical protein [Gammaproteobacteria bacterium]MBU2071785.1 hypothetical protein [Gammaproteobacteria bacterium]MBU2183902.1 hypothetical protein [Gammaproteobacteria bacterium]MBU2203057.1 hypothetical protein [Gammaproteobacteria bacterium]